MSDQSGGSPPPGPSQAADVHAALALARASVRALLDASPDTAARVRAALRKEAVGLDMKGVPETRVAAAAIRRMLDES
jgi:hypothetical protein